MIRAGRARSIVRKSVKISLASRASIQHKSSATRRLSNMAVASHTLATDPDLAWKVLGPSQTFYDVSALPPETPIADDKVRFVFTSDTHCKTAALVVPDGDVLLYGGDFTKSGDPREVIPFNEFLGTLPHPIKLVIAGNHELAFDLPNSPKKWREEFRECGVDDPRELLTNCIYIQDESAVIHGIKVYGAPWAPRYRQVGSFIADRGPPLASRWSRVPDDTDILISHCPPLGRGDLTRRGYRTGCLDLLMQVQNRIRPKYHLFGHIHEGYGISSDGVTTFINGAHCALHYVPTNQPFLFDLPLPGHVKDKSNLDVELLFRS